MAPERLADSLADGCTALGLSVDQAAQQTMLNYVALIDRWNKVHNLTAVREPGDMVRLHLLDSLAVVPVLCRDPGLPASLVDVGSGAGLPGLVLAIVWPQTQITLVEPAQKKAAFLRQCVGQLGLSNVTVLDRRVQDLSGASFASGPPALIICRAYTRLTDFVAQCQPLAGRQTTIAAMKGPKVAEEIAEYEETQRALSGSDKPDMNKIRFRVRITEELSVPGVDGQRFLVLLDADASQADCA